MTATTSVAGVSARMGLASVSHWRRVTLSARSSLFRVSSFCAHSRSMGARQSGGGTFPECPFFTTDLYITSVIIALCAMLSAGGGIGGGAMFVPVYLMVYGLTAHEAVPL